MRLSISLLVLIATLVTALPARAENPVPPAGAGVVLPEAAQAAARASRFSALQRFFRRGANGVQGVANTTAAAVTQKATQVGQTLSKTPYHVKEMLRQASPKHLYKTAKTNYAEKRFYATDLSEHSTRMAALKASFAPVDTRANVKAAVYSKVHPMRFVGNIIDPLSIELQRQVAAGKLDAGRLVQTLNPLIWLPTMAGGAAGDIAGAVVQSSLARLGPIGATAGFFVRPMMGFAGQLLGMNVGESMVRGNATFRGAMAQALRDIKPGRDMGMLAGGVIGSTLGQVLIPIPVVGGIIGGMIGGTIGTFAGQGLAKLWPFSLADRGMRSALGKLADWIDDRKKPAASQPAPAEPSATASAEAPKPASSEPASPSPSAELASAPASKRPASAEDGISMDDLPRVERR